MTMISKFNKHLSFRLNIVGYEFPSSTDYWDSNWLKVSVELNDVKNGIRFSRVDPCLLTTELKRLREWFQSIALDRICCETFTLMEPELSFEYIEKKVSLLLNYNFNPTGLKADGLYRLEIESREIEKIIDSLDASLLEFPIRNNPS